MDQYPSSIYLAYKKYSDSYKSTIYYPVDDIYTVGAGTLNRSQYYYSMDISTFFQHVLNNTIDNEKWQIWINPITQLTNSYTGAVSYYVDNQIYCKATLNGPKSTRKPRIEITYTVLP